MNISNNPQVATTTGVKTEKPVVSNNSSNKDSEKSIKARKVIEEFEGVFMSMIVKQLRETDNGEGFFPGDHSDTFGGMFDMYMGQHIAKGADTGLDQLFESTAAKRQLEDYVARKTSVMQQPKEQSKGIEEYRNEQFRSNAAVLPAGA